MPEFLAKQAGNVIPLTWKDRDFLSEYAPLVSVSLVNTVPPQSRSQTLKTVLVDPKILS